jgi:hypothetical protein
MNYAADLTGQLYVHSACVVKLVPKIMLISTCSKVDVKENFIM